YVPNSQRAEILRFEPDGRLSARWALPSDFQAPSGCVAARGDRIYLVDGRGALLVFDPDGRQGARWTLPEAAGSVAGSPDGARIFTLSPSHLLAVSTSDGQVSSWDLAQPSDGAVALSGGRVLVGAHADMQLDIYCPDGRVCGRMGQTGTLPGQFEELGG